MLKRLAVILLSCSAASLMNAATLYFEASGQFASTDVAGSLVAPNGSFSLMFDANAAPVPLSGSVTSLGFNIPIDDFSYKLNGTSINVLPSSIRFSTLSNGGLFDITIGAGLNAIDFSFSGTQLFTGTTAAPTFSALGNVSGSSVTYSDPANYDVQNAAVSVIPTPEPASLALLFTALVSAALALAARQLGSTRFERKA